MQLKKIMLALLVGGLLYAGYVYYGEGSAYPYQAEAEPASTINVQYSDDLNNPEEQKMTERDMEAYIQYHYDDVDHRPEHTLIAE